MDGDALATRNHGDVFDRVPNRGAWGTRRQVRLRSRHRAGSWIAAVVALLMLADGVASVLMPLPAAAPARLASPATSPAAWLDIPHPLQLYGLSGSSFARLPLSYAARRRALGAERQDIVTYGEFDDAAPYLRLSIDRSDGPPGPVPDLLVDLARLAATDALAVTRVGLPLNLMTRFGLFHTADITLARGPVALPCLGFRLAQPGVVAITGVTCGSETRPLDRSMLGCMIDRIDLVSAGDDEAVRDVFVAAERRRTDQCWEHRRGPEAP